MPRYLLAVTFADGNGVPPMTEWTPEEVQAHLGYHGALNDELIASGEVDVESEERAIEIAGKVSAVPGPGGVATRQPIHVRRVMDRGPGNAAEMDSYVRTGA